MHKFRHRSQGKTPMIQWGVFCLEQQDNIETEKEEFCMTAGKPNMVYSFGVRKNTSKPLPVVSSERIAQARENVAAHTKQK